MREQACGACGGSLGQAHDHPCEARGLDRRELLKRGGLAAAALLLAACGVPGSDGTGPGLGSPVTVKLSDYPALANSGGVALVGLAPEEFGVSPSVLRNDYLLAIAYLDPSARPQV